MDIKMWTTERSQVTSAAVLAVGFVLAAIIAAYAFYAVHTLNNTIVVTGSATRDVTADGAKWSIGVSRSTDVSGVSDGKSILSSDSQSIVRFLMGNGIASTSIEISPVFADQNYDSNSQVHSYNIHRDITVDSKDPQLIKKLADKITSVTAGDSVISAQTPEYYVSDLATVRVELIGDAVKDAAARAGQIAKSTGQSVGALQSASTGVVQVLAPHSGGDVSDYGTYDTSTIDKTVMVTTHATFYLR
jgi:hypothetical protein